jgi:hypothetical protein
MGHAISHPQLVGAARQCLVSRLAQLPDHRRVHATK